MLNNAGPIAIGISVAGLLGTGCDTGKEDGAEPAPNECVGVELFDSEACLEAVMTECRALVFEDDCWAAESIEIAPPNGNIVHCRWTEVVALANTQTCEIESAFGRCEAALGAGLNGSVADPCVNGAFVEPGHLAMLDDDELVDLSPAPDGTLYTEPIGPWSLIGGSSASVASCVEGASPAGPDWCACGPAACAATAGDHGMVESGRFIDLESVFRKHGLSVYDASTVTHVVLRERLGQMWTRWPDAILVSGGSNITQVYLRDADGAWSPASPAADREKLEHRRPDVDALVRTLVEQPGIGQVLRSIPDDGVEISARENRAARVVGRRDAEGVRWAYVIADDAVADPFDYLQDADIAQMVARVGRLDDASFHSADAWMERTMHHRYPGAVALVSKAFHPQRFTGDLMLTALPGWSFLRSFGGDHGNLERESMLAPLVVNGPGIEHARAPRLVRLVDLYPTAAVLLGASPDDPALRELDGRPIPGARGP